MCAGGKHESRLQSAMEDSEEHFHCLVCLDLVYKPIVQSCGHVFCFWCVHRAMNAKRQSQCPVCRRPYVHFPRVCEKLHCFLMKAMPEEYSRRAQETQEMEETRQIFSPRIPESPISPRKEDDTTKVRQCGRSPVLAGDENGVSEQQGGLIDAHGNSLESPTLEDLRSCSSPGAVSTSGEETEVVLQQGGFHRSEDEACSELTVQDFSCASCKRFLHRPVALNCGQLLCESCVKKCDSFISCPSCRHPHPGGSVHVCLELHHYLERAFPADYLERKEEVLAQEMTRETANESNIDSEISDAKEVMAYDGTELRQFVHIGTGCDGCGMFPIVGDRYSCKDCGEKIGYDLCGACRRKGGSLICGRFNQQHTLAHRMKEIAGEFRVAIAGPLRLNLANGTIQRRRLRQQLLDDLDDYIDSFM